MGSKVDIAYIIDFILKAIGLIFIFNSINYCAP